MVCFPEWALVALNTLLTISMGMAQGYRTSTPLPLCAAVVSLLKGLGAFARPNISRGTLILSEKPLFKVPSLVQDAERVQNMVAQSLCALDKEQQRRFLEPSISLNSMSLWESLRRAESRLASTPDKGAFSLPSPVSTLAASPMQFIHGMETRGGESLRCQDYQGQGGDYSQLLRDACLVCPEKSQTGPNQSRLWIYLSPPNLRWISRFGRL